MRQRIGGSQADGAAQFFIQAAHFALGAADFLFDGAEAAAQGFAGAGHHIAGLQALEQAHAERLLKAVDPTQHGGVVDAQLTRRSRNGAAARDGGEVAQVFPVKFLHICLTVLLF